MLGRGAWPKIERIKQHMKKCPSLPKATVSSANAEKLEELAAAIDEADGFTSSEDLTLLSPTPSSTSASVSRSSTPTAKRSRQPSGI